MAVSFFLPPRSGYDNNHAFVCLGMRYFGSRPEELLSFKELSPLLTDALTDWLSGYSLHAILLKNRLLPLLSALTAFAALRRLGASLAVGAAGTGLVFLSFLSALSGSSFSTTSANVFIWLASLAAIAELAACAAPGPRELAWIAASAALTAGTRAEFLPVNGLLACAAAAARFPELKRRAREPLFIAVLAAGAALAAAWGSWHLATYKSGQLAGEIMPARNAAYQLAEKNLLVLFGAGGAGEERNPGKAAYALTAALLLAAAGMALSPAAAGLPPAAAPLAAALAGFAYFSAIFIPMDLYPLQFTRHRLYFLIPFAGLWALGLAGLERAAAAAGRLRPFRAACWAALAVYAALNSVAALKLNGSLRTDDRELALLARAQTHWPEGCGALYAARPKADARLYMLNKYFPSFGADAGAACALKYVSPEQAAFSRPAGSPMEQRPLEAGAGEPWMTDSFPHAFYTMFDGGGAGGWAVLRESREPLPLTIGFFRAEATGTDASFTSLLAGARLFDVGNFAGAAAKFRAAAAADPGCLRCRYFLALSLAAGGDARSAGEEYGKAAAAFPGALGAGHKALLAALAAGDFSRADPALRKLSASDPALLAQLNLFGGVWRLAGVQKSAR